MNTWGDRRANRQAWYDDLLLDEDRFEAKHFGTRFIDVGDIFGPPVEIPPPEVPDYTMIGKTPMHVYGTNRRCERCGQRLTMWSPFTLCNRVELSEIIDEDSLRKLWAAALNDGLKDWRSYGNDIEIADDGAGQVGLADAAPE